MQFRDSGMDEYCPMSPFSWMQNFEPSFEASSDCDVYQINLVGISTNLAAFPLSLKRKTLSRPMPNSLWAYGSYLELLFPWIISFGFISFFHGWSKIPNSLKRAEKKSFFSEKARLFHLMDFSYQITCLVHICLQEVTISGNPVWHLHNSSTVSFVHFPGLVDDWFKHHTSITIDELNQTISKDYNFQLCFFKKKKKKNFEHWLIPYMILPFQKVAL